MSSECEKLIDWIMSYFDPHWESLGPEKRDEILVKAKQLFQAAIDERVEPFKEFNSRLIQRVHKLEQKVEALEKPCLLQRIPDTRGGHFETECGHSPEFVTYYCLNCGRKVKRTDMESEESHE